MATYTVAFNDRYAIQASQERLEFVARLREFSQISESEYTDDQLGAWADQALIHANKDLKWSTLADPYTKAVLLLAAIAVAQSRMQSASRFFPVSSVAGSTDPSARVRNQAEVIKSLRAELEEYIKETGINMGVDGIIQGTLIRRDYRTDYMLPFDQQLGPKPALLQLVSVAVATAQFIWSECTDSDFYKYHIYISETPGLADPVRINEGTNRGVRSDAEALESIERRPDTGRVIGDLEAATTYFVVVVTEDLNGRVAVSNEVQFTTLVS